VRPYRFLVSLAVIPMALVSVAQSAPAAGAKAHWQVVSSPGGRPALLSSTSFAAPSDGWAVGQTGESLTPDGIDPLIEHWDGAQWRVVASPAVPYSNEVLTGVSSTGPSDAWAVGWQDPYGTERVHALLMHWDGQTWSTANGPNGAGIVRAVDARTPDDVWAVGVGLFEHFDGSHWSVIPSPRRAVNPAAVTAIATDDAWAVGTRPARGTGYPGRSEPYVAHWDGSSWSSVAVPHPAVGARLAGMSAASPTDIWAVGSTNSSPASPYALHYDGSTWKKVTLPGAGDGSGLSGVSVVSSGDVWAVGNQDGSLRNGFAVWRTFTEHWDGSAWSIVPSPNDSRHDNFLVAAAASGGRVWAFGGDGGTLVERR
jgi:hypothetical protein